MDKYEHIRSALEEQIGLQNAAVQKFRRVLESPHYQRERHSFNATLIQELIGCVEMQAEANHLVGQLITLLDSRIED